MVLLVGAGTFIRALDGLLTQPVVGASHAAQVLTANVALPPQAYADDGQRIHFLENVAERLRQQPGVLAASAANTVPGPVLGRHQDIRSDERRVGQEWVRTGR